MATIGSSLDLYEPLDVIGNGSFAIVRKVRRKSDGAILARKELNFDRMSERDRKQIVSEVNILKDLSHENIIRYHDRFVDRDAGILYILMEYCGGGDLSTVIKQCGRINRPLPEDTIWSYFFQILLALQYCHCPNVKSGDGANSTAETGNGPKRQQILHRDLKPENVFLDDNNTVKLGDFGLSKALGQASFANTYVGTPYYMSPELMQEKSYDAKSDIWSLGCLIYELCALKPPFHEAKTHNELSSLIRNGRIPPLPKGYSHALGQVIKSMLNLNPAMRPSTQQLLQHERIDFARKVFETQKMLAAVKAHKSSVLATEHELQRRETALAQREAELTQKEVNCLSQFAVQTEERVKEAVAIREQELREAVMKREEEVRNAMAKREEEILEAVRKREDEINEAWRAREEQLRTELKDAIEWVQNRQQELGNEAAKLERARVDIEKEVQEMAAVKAAGGRKDKSPFEDVKNLLAPLVRLSHMENERTPKRSCDTSQKFLELATPISRGATAVKNFDSPQVVPGSAMRGVILTATGEAIATPRSTELTTLIRDSPRVGLNFRRIFDFDSESEDDDVAGIGEEEESDCAKVKEHEIPSPTERDKTPGVLSRAPSDSDGKLPPTRLRRPSIRTSTGGQRRPALPHASTWSNTQGGASTADSATSSPIHASLVRSSATSSSTPTVNINTVPPTPRYDPDDHDSLPSPFLKRVEREKLVSAGTRAGTTGTLNGKISATGTRRSNGNLLRAMAAANSANSLNSISPSPSYATSGDVRLHTAPVTGIAPAKASSQ